MSGETPELPIGFAMRPMHAADLPAVHALETRLFPADAWPMEFFVDELQQVETGTREYRVVTAEDGTDGAGDIEGWEPGAVLGYCGLLSGRPLADVQTIAVVPEAEGRGLGTTMLLWMVSEATRRRAEDLLLEVRADNPRAQALYRRHGFEHIHTRASYYPDGVDALIMRRRLKYPS